MKKTITLLILILSFANADLAIEPWGTSYHWDRDKNRNENNQYVGINYRFEKYEVGVATFINSFNRRGNVVYAGIREPLFKYVTAYVDVGYVTGYNYKMMAAVGVYVEYEDVYIKTSINHKYLGLTIGYVFKGI